MPQIPTEQIRKMRDARVNDRGRLQRAPVDVQNTNELYIRLLNEVLEYREAEEASERGEFANFAIPIRGTVQ